MTETQENLLAAYFANQLTDQQREEILTLLDTDSEFATRFAQMEEAYVAAFISAFEKTKEEDFRILEEKINPRRRVFPFWKPFAVAASIAAVIACGLAIYNGKKYQDAERFIAQSDVTTISATQGFGTQTLLPDGTRVFVNAASSVSFGRDFGREGREVKMEGECLFEVAADASRPFRVHAGNTCVTVKGTVFNVRSYADEASISVSLLEGSVLLSSPSGEVTLRPGTCAIVSREDGKIRMEKADLSVSEWTRGKIVFTDKTIPEILSYVERIYGVRFLYNEDLFQGERFTGIISSRLSIDEILSYIDVDQKYVWQKQEDSIVIHKK